jgi:hypothetical protein
MAPTVSLLAHIGPAGAELAALVGGIDAQSLPSAAFEVTFLLDAVDSPARRRLDELATRRPNVRVRVGAAGDPAAAVADAAGEWLLYLGPGLLARGCRLRPRALERLLDAAATEDCDLVVARTDIGAMVNDLFATTAVDPPPPDSLLEPFAVLYRREFAVRNGVAHDADSARSLAKSARRVAVCGDYPCVAIADPDVLPAQQVLTLTDSSTEWRDGTLQVSVHGTAAADGELRLALRRQGGEQFWLPGATAVSTGSTVAATTWIDLRTAALGKPLDQGRWTVVAGVHQRSAAWTAQLDVPGTRIGPAVIEGTLVAPVKGTSLGLDVGARAQSALPRLAPSDVVIEDSVAGATMTVALPGMHVHGDSVTQGSVLLGTFVLRAALVAADRTARVTCMLSGLAGRYRLSTQFGAAAPARTLLILEISDVGDMRVVRAPAKRAAANKAPGAAGRAAAPRPASLVGRLRRRIPPSLEPAARALARNERARAWYRRLSGASAGRSRHRAPR